MRTTAIIAAAGCGSRMGAGKNKLLLSIGGQSVAEHTVSVFVQCGRIDDIVIAARPEEIDFFKERFSGIKKPVRFVPGGAERRESVMNGLLAADGADIVAIHDGARALVTEQIICQTLDCAIRYGAAAPGIACFDSLKRADKNGFIIESVDRNGIYMIQTPQIFRYSEILAAHRAAKSDGISATDDCALYEKYIGRVKITGGSAENIKLTVPEDIVRAEQILSRRKQSQNGGY